MSDRFLLCMAMKVTRDMNDAMRDSFVLIQQNFANERRGDHWPTHDPGDRGARLLLTCAELNAASDLTMLRR
jgi:hypothetical protein